MTRVHAEPYEMSSSNDALFPLPPQTNEPLEVLECDVNTADCHVPRDPRLIRLTGIHPFNCEAPLSALYDNGFLTPTELWYVRNHGAVPQVFDEDVLNWEFSIEGLVENPMVFNLSELLKLPQVTMPITLVCAGNRRKEQNIIRKGKGFNWGSAGVSTALFTGVLINRVLDLVKLKQTAKYMCMEGADDLPNGRYGTSIRLSTAMNSTMGVMLAYKMNGEPLLPDHGRPLRVVIPAQIGGRSVKWLKKIILTEKPSDNWYHIYDNRVLPTMLTPEMVDKDQSWWYDERYALYNLNVQSVICYPAHEEIVKIADNQVYHVRGYAYGGGGVRVGRVEISLDQGHTWKLTHINYPEDRYREIEGYPQLFGGTLDMKDRDLSFCWCFWSLEISVQELSQSKDIVVRAMDESMNIQPRDMYWNVLSMLNNCWHRLTILKEQNEEVLKFEHPCVPAMGQGGWMEKVKAQGGDLRDGFWGNATVVNIVRSKDQSIVDVQMINDSIKRLITEDELAKHDKDGDTWFAINGHVYDASEYLKDHPGGKDSIILASGMDASDEFFAIHSESTKSMLQKYHIGILQATKSDKIDGDIFLNQKEWKKVILKSKKTLNHDSLYLIFSFEHPQQKLGIPVGKHLYLRCTSLTGEEVTRPYSPISHVDQLGEFHLIIKLYRGDSDRPAGKMSACIDRLRENDVLQCKGPFGHCEYRSNGIMFNKKEIHQIKKLTMIAGGSGITPIYQFLRYAYADGIECDVIYYNKTEEDILLREELQTFKQVRHCLTRANDQWNGHRGHISQEIIGHPHKGVVLCCGPAELEQSVRQLLEKNEWDVEHQFIRFQN